MRKHTMLVGAAALIGAMTPAERARGRYMRAPDGHTETKTTAQLAQEAKTAFETKHNEVKTIAEKALAEAEKGIELSGTVKELADEALIGMNEAKARLDTLEQKMVRDRSDDSAVPQLAGQQFVESEDFKSFSGNVKAGRSVAVEMKAITSLTTNADGSAGAWVRPERVQGMLTGLADRRMTVRELIAPGTTSSSAIEYVQETGFANNAGMTAEGTTKPESSIKYGLKTANVRKIAHWMLASAEILADAPGLQSMIDYRLRYGLEFKEETQILNGDGTGQNLLGINPQATAFARPFVPQAGTVIDTIRLAMLQVALAEYPASGHVLHPTDWAKIELTKDTQGRYIIGNPQGAIAPTLWGLPVVATQAQAAGVFTTGSWKMAAQLFDRLSALVMVSTEDSDNFRKNMVTILAEERLALTVYRPEAFVTGPLTAVTA